MNKNLAAPARTRRGDHTRAGRLLSPLGAVDWRQASEGRAVRVALRGGNFKLVRGSWNSAYLDELMAFPTGAFDHQVDASSGAFSKVVYTGQPYSAVVDRRICATLGSAAGGAGRLQRRVSRTMAWIFYHGSFVASFRASGSDELVYR